MTEARDALVAMKRGEGAFASGNFQDSYDSYSRAIALAEGLPESYPFDKPVFIARCKAGLSAASGQLTHFAESVRYADEALQFYERCGRLYPVEFGCWYMATFNKGASLANLGRLAEGMEWIQRAKAMLSESSDADPEKAKCENAIVAIAAAQKRAESPKSFWGKLRSGF